MLAVMGGWTVRLLAAALFTLLAAACEDEEPKAPDGPPDTVEEFYAALEYGLESDGRPYHALVTFETTENGQTTTRGTTEVWLDLEADVGRWEFHKDDSWTADIAGNVVSVFADGAHYSLNKDIEGERVGRRRGVDLRPCVREAPSYLLGAIACGFLPTDLGQGWEPAVEESEVEGHPSLALLLTRASEPQAYPTDVPPPPGGWPTPHPVVAAATRAEWRLHLDPDSYLPIAVTQGLDSDPGMQRLGSVIRYEGGFIDRSALPKDAFSPEALGYVAPDEEERRKLEDPALQTPVYWLGRSFDPGGGLPALGGLDVNHYSPGLRPPTSDAPNIQVGLAYRGGEGFVRLDHFPPGDWEDFKARLGGNFPWTWCAESREFTVGDAKVTILAGHESFPYREDPGVVTIVTPGQEPPTPDRSTPTPPPLKTEPCPGTPHDRFMAEVRFPDATIVINGTLRYGGQSGSTFGPYDTDAALEVVARGLRMREPGE